MFRIIRKTRRVRYVLEYQKQKQNSSKTTFLLFLQKKKERCLEPSEKPAELKAQWAKEKNDKKKDQTEPIFLFKKKIFLKDDDREMGDPVAKDLIYKQVCFINHFKDKTIISKTNYKFANSKLGFTKCYYF